MAAAMTSFAPIPFLIPSLIAKARNITPSINVNIISKNIFFSLTIAYVLYLFFKLLEYLCSKCAYINFFIFFAISFQIFGNIA